MVKRLWWQSVVLSGALLLSACGTPSAGGPGGNAQQRPGGPPPAAVSAQKPTTGPIASGLTFSGDVTASQQTNLAPKISGIIVKLTADVGSIVKAGQQVAELDHASLDAAVTQAQAGLEVAKAKLAQVQAQGRTEDVTKAQAALDSAKGKLGELQNTSGLQAALDASKAKLTALQNGPRPEQVVIYQRAIDVAKNNLNSAQISRDATCRSVGSAQCSAANETVNAAQTALDQANQQYQLNIAPPVSTDVAQAVDAVRQAQAAVDNSALQIQEQQAAVSSAAAALQEAKQPYVATDFESAQANVDAAQAQLQAAQVNQQQAFVTAPFDGIISAKLLSEGALASPSAPIFTLVSQAVEIDIPVAQEQIGQVKKGQAAQLTTPALPNQTIVGKILNVAPAADPKSRSFMVQVVPATQDGKLKPGMSAAITLVTAQKPSAMLIPKDAIVLLPNGTQPGVFVVKPGPNNTHIAVFTPLTLGISNDTSTEVVSGLSPDDLVVVQGQAALNNNQPIRLSAGGPGPAPAGSSGTGASGRAGPAGARGSAGTSGGGAPSASARPSAGSFASSGPSGRPASGQAS